MDEKKNRPEDQPAGNREEGQTPQNMGAPEELLAQVSAGPIAFPDDFVENILSDLEESASDFPELPVEPLTATPIAGSAPAQTPPQEAEEKTDSAPRKRRNCPNPRGRRLKRRIPKRFLRWMKALLWCKMNLSSQMRQRACL